MLRLRTLGSLDLRGPAGEERLIGRAAQPKCVALLAFLAVDDRRGFHRRDSLVALLWPDLDQSRARAALRKALHYLRRLPGTDLVLTRGDEEVRLDLARLWCDAREVTRLAVAGDRAGAVELYVGDFLPGLHVSAAPEFEQWLEAQRNNLRATIARCALELAGGYRATGRFLEALPWARRAVEIGPLEERPNRMLIELLAATGDRPAALAAYEWFAHRLAAELDLDPGPETRSLADRLRSEPPQRADQALPPTRLEPITDDVTGEPPSPPEGRAPAKTRDVRDGRWRRSTMALLAVVAGFVVVAWPFKRFGEGSARDSVTAIARGNALRPLSEAYVSYVKGLYHARQWPQPRTEKLAIREYEKVLAKDPSFASARAALVQVLLYTAGSSPADLARAKVEARRALEFNPRLPEAYVALGIVRMRDWDWKGSEEALRRAVAFDSNSAVAHQWYAQLLRQTMRLEEASIEARRAAELDPLSLQIKTLTIGGVLFNQHRYEEAIRVWQNVLELDPSYGLAAYHEGLAYAMLGHGEDVIAATERAAAPLANGRYELPTVWLRGMGYAVMGQRARAEAVLRQLENQYASAPRAPGLTAALHLRLGRREQALDWLERGYARRDPALANITSEPWFDDIRAHPRFRALRGRMGLP
jgi:DNA-binding SARP family transcriptional activator/Tfp pilus assembly protein PilF